MAMAAQVSGARLFWLGFFAFASASYCLFRSLTEDFR